MKELSMKKSMLGIFHHQSLVNDDAYYYDYYYYSFDIMFD